jgi:drug/metabolite transporter (DMT)-like permease
MGVPYGNRAGEAQIRSESSRILAYLRFAFAAYLAVDFVRNIISVPEDVEWILVAIGGLLYAPFVTYCILIGIQRFGRSR